jgi:hypothetical protein
MQLDGESQLVRGEGKRGIAARRIDPGGAALTLAELESLT